MKSHAENRKKGDIGENIASRYLVNRGFCIWHRNYRKKWGELDIIAVKDGMTHFFEVKSITADLVSHIPDDHRPEENVHAFKLKQIRRMVQTYFMEFGNGQEHEFGFHVLCVFMDMKRRRARIRWLKDVIL